VIIWQRFFAYFSYKYTTPVIICAVGTLLFSVGSGGALHFVTGKTIFIAAFAILPLVEITFLTFYGFFINNDY